MLCLGFICMLFGLHACKLRSPDYRKLSRHTQIDQCYYYLHIIARTLNLFYSSQHILKHYAVVHPIPYLLLWVIPESKGFSTVLSFSMIHPYLGLAVACGYPLSWLEAFIVLWRGSLYSLARKDPLY